MPNISASNPVDSTRFQLSEDEILDLLYLARTGALSELKEDLEAHSLRINTGPAAVLHAAYDPNTGNNAAHFAAANAHLNILSHIQETESHERPFADGAGGGEGSASLSLFHRVNNQGSTALHYAAVNGQLNAVKRLLGHPIWAQDKVKLKEFVELRNRAGRTARDEADTLAGGRPEWLRVSALLEKYEVGREVDTAAEEELDLDEVGESSKS